MSYRLYMHIYEVHLKQHQTSVFLMDTDWSRGQSGISCASENLRPLPDRDTFSWLSWVVQQQHFPILSNTKVHTIYWQWRHKATHTHTNQNYGNNFLENKPKQVTVRKGRSCHPGMYSHINKAVTSM